MMILHRHRWCTFFSEVDLLQSYVALKLEGTNELDFQKPRIHHTNEFTVQDFDLSKTSVFFQRLSEYVGIERDRTGSNGDRTGIERDRMGIY